MRIPLARAGWREMLILTLILGFGAGLSFFVAAAWSIGWLRILGGLLLLAWAAGIAFFRDPDRRTPAAPDALIAAADGKVVEVARLDGHENIPGVATRISVFLSVLDVHINRSPCAGVVRETRYRPGRFLDARHPDCGALNEANAIVIDPDPPHVGPVVVRQVAGKIARRIVCDVAEGDRVQAGQRIGLIKFGSRTEVIVPGHDNYDPCVAIGDRSRGAETILARRTTTAAQRPERTDHVQTGA